MVISDPPHNNKKIQFKPQIVKSFKNDPLGRKVYESIKIMKSKKEDKYPMNTKDEYNQAMIVVSKHTKGIFE